MDLNELSNAWNELRNAAWGRGTQPAVPLALADRIGREWQSFRDWLAEQGVLEDVFASLSASKWVARYRQLALELRTAGGTLDHSVELEETPLEKLKDAGSGFTRGLGIAAVVAAAVAAGVLVMAIGGRR